MTGMLIYGMPGGLWFRTNKSTATEPAEQLAPSRGALCCPLAGMKV